MKYQRATFKVKVYKDQTVGANEGVIVATGDTVTLAIRNSGRAATSQDVVLTNVLDGGRTIEWDAQASNYTISNDVIRPHQKHNYSCPGLRNFVATLTESSPTTVAMSVTSITLSGATFPVGISEESAANGITPEFVEALLAKLNQILGYDGTFTGVVTGTAGSQVLTLRAIGTQAKWTAIAGAGATIVQPTAY